MGLFLNYLIYIVLTIVGFCLKFVNKKYGMEDKTHIDKVEEPAEACGIEYTYADYLNFDFEEMVELIKGRIFKMSPAPRINHQEVSINLLKQLLKFFENKACKVYHAPTDVILPIGDKKESVPLR